MPYGRGGAGNIEAHEHDKVRVAADLEANHQAPKSSPETHVPLTDDERKYAHSGRGGSGNYYSPQELSQTGSFSDAHRSHVLGDGTLAPADATSMGNTDGAETSSYIAAQASVRPTRTVGRGGAGNFDFGAGVSEEKAARERMDEEQKRKRVLGNYATSSTSITSFPQEELIRTLREEIEALKQRRHREVSPTKKREDAMEQ
ncbi:hypothetical protein LTS02_010095 [Friedmanniomyces endolithicus]|nr:hypothetical protein LTS02_010095 [Friedmanniomyces endolithicus]